MASVFYREYPSGRRTYYVTWWQEGRKLQERVGGSKSAAQYRRAQIEQQLAEAGVGLGAGPLSVREATRMYVEEWGPTWGQTHRQQVTLCLGQFSEYVEGLGVQLLGDISESDVRRWLGDRLAGPRRPVSVARDLRNVKTFLHRASRARRTRHGVQRWIPMSPASEIPEPKHQKVRDRYVTREEFEWVVEAVERVTVRGRRPALYVRPAVMLAYYAGLRRGEIARLSIEDVDWDAGRLAVRALEEKNHRPRSVPLCARLRGELVAWCGGRSSGPVLGVNCQGGTITGEALDRAVGVRVDAAAAANGADLTGVCLHALRHAFCSNLLDAGHLPADVMQLMGHRTLAMTMGQYYHPRHAARGIVDTLPGASDVAAG